MAVTIFEGEAELAVVIGKRASHVKAADAMSYVFGYTNFIDGSARGVVPPTNVFYQMKSRDTFAPIGPISSRPTRSRIRTSNLVQGWGAVQAPPLKRSTWTTQRGLLNAAHA